MPRYSYVIAFPVLIALCIGINIQRYPAVSAMLRGEPVESRWRGRSEVFNFRGKKSPNVTSYQSSRSDSAEAVDTKGAREPIPLSESRSNGNSGNTGSTNANSSERYGNSYNGNSNSSSSNRSDSTLSTPPSKWDSYDHNYDAPSDRNNDKAADSESRTNTDKRWPDSSTNGGIGNTYRTDSPAPGYSNRFSAGEGTSIPVTTSTSAAETLPATPRTPKTLTPQEKLDLRMATPFSMSPSSSQTSSEQYIPPDFLPAHENGVVQKLHDPSKEPAASISPVDFNATVTRNP